MRKHILVVEDDEKLGRQIQRFLSQYGFDVGLEGNGRAAISRIVEEKPDVVILDLMLPDADGFEVCRAVRGEYRGKLLILTASDDDMDHVAGLEMGADDFLVKPIHPRVLLAHLRVLLRENPNAESGQARPQKCIQFGALCLLPVQRRVILSEREVVLTPAEFDVLLLLAQHAEQVVSRDDILRRLRGIEYDGLDRSVDVKISALRRKLGDNLAQPKHIITVRAKGYLLVPDSWS